MPNSRHRFAIFKPLPFVLVMSLLLVACSTGMTVVGISDGDTLTFIQHKTLTKVRISAIDAPEQNQLPYGAEAKQALSDLCLKQPARLVYVDTDRYKRIVGDVYCNSKIQPEKNIPPIMAAINNTPKNTHFK